MHFKKDVCQKGRCVVPPSVSRMYDIVAPVSDNKLVAHDLLPSEPAFSSIVRLIYGSTTL